STRGRPPPGTGPLMAPSYSDRARPSPGTLVPLRSHVARRSSADAGCDPASSTSEYSYVAPVLCCGVQQGESRLTQPQPRLTRVQAFRRLGQQPLGLTWASWARFYFRILGRSAPSPLLRLSIDHKTFDVLGPESNASPARARSRTIPSHRRDTAPYPCSRGVRTELDRASRFSLGARLTSQREPSCRGTGTPKWCSPFFGRRPDGARPNGRAPAPRLIPLLASRGPAARQTRAERGSVQGESGKAHAVRAAFTGLRAHVDRSIVADARSSVRQRRPPTYPNSSRSSGGRMRT